MKLFHVFDILHFLMFFIILGIFALTQIFWVGVIAILYLTVGGLILGVIMDEHRSYFNRKSFDDPIVEEVEYSYPNNNETVSTSKPYRYVSPSDRIKVFDRDNYYTCQICGKNVKEDGVKLELDHIYPISKGGSNDMSNLQTLCKECNRGKSDKILHNQMNK